MNCACVWKQPRYDEDEWESCDMTNKLICPTCYNASTETYLRRYKEADDDDN